MAIRVICDGCGAKLDIREELAGTKRRCPKCKTEFAVPTPADDEEGVDVVESSDDEPAPPAPTKSATAPTKDDLPLVAKKPAVKPALTPLPDMNDDDDDDDYIPSFMTAASAADQTDRKTPLPPVASKKDTVDDDDGPMLSIPKVPPTAKPKFKPFIPEEMDDDEDKPPPRPAARSTPPARERSSRPLPLSDEFDIDAKSPPPKSRSAPRDFDRPTPSRGGLSDSEVPATSGTRDRAQAARELRQALKDSSLRYQPEQPDSKRRFSFDFAGLWNEFGMQGVAILAGTIVVCLGLYYLSDQMMGDRLKLPKLGQVTGTVTFNGQPAAFATVYFQPVAEQGTDAESTNFKKIRTSFGQTDEKGEYKLMYAEGIPGVKIGKCRIWLQLQPPMVAPGEYSNVSLTFKDVAAGSQTFNFPLSGPQPKK